MQRTTLLLLLLLLGFSGLLLLLSAPAAAAAGAAVAWGLSMRVVAALPAAVSCCGRSSRLQGSLWSKICSQAVDTSKQIWSLGFQRE
jgi:hypothetical protein